MGPFWLYLGQSIMPETSILARSAPGSAKERPRPEFHTNGTSSAAFGGVPRPAFPSPLHASRASRTMDHGPRLWGLGAWAVFAGKTPTDIDIVIEF